MTNESYTPVSESLFISDDNIYYNFDKWKNGETNVLLITGYSGGGKTTLSKKLAREYHCKCIEIDLFSNEIKKKYPKCHEMTKEDRRDFVVRKAISTYKHERVIIEGAQIGISNIPIKEFKDHAIIVVNTSISTATLRAWKRAFENPDRLKLWHDVDSDFELMMVVLNQGPNRFKTNYQMSNKMEPFMREIKRLSATESYVNTNRFVTEGIGSGTYDYPLNALNLKKFIRELPALKNAKVGKGYRGLIHARLEQPVAHPVAFVNIELKTGNIQASHGDPGWIGKAKAKILQHTPHKATKESYDHFVTEGEIGMMKNPYNKFGNKKVTRRVDHKQAVKHPSMIKKYVNSHESYTDFF
jgi:adenylate kinase family enzyme